MTDRTKEITDIIEREVELAYQAGEKYGREEGIKAGYEMRCVEEMFEAKSYVTPTYTCKVDNLSPDAIKTLSRGNIQLIENPSENGDLRRRVETIKEAINILERRVVALEKRI